MLNAPNQNNLLSQIQQIKNMISGKNPDELYNELMKNNQQFREFVQNNQGKSAEQIARENGIDLSFMK